MATSAKKPSGSEFKKLREEKARAEEELERVKTAADALAREADAKERQRELARKRSQRYRDNQKGILSESSKSGMMGRQVCNVYRYSCDA